MTGYVGATLVGAFWTVPGDQSGDEAQIAFAVGPIHYDILFPATPDTIAAFDRAGVTLPYGADGVEWLVVGWGAETFYTTVGSYADVSVAAVWRGITGDSAVMRVDLAGVLPDDPRFRVVRLSQTQLTDLRTQVLTDLTGAAPLNHPGFTASDDFYPAKGRFHLLRTCNVWVGEKLRTAGLTLGAWTPTPYALTLSLWWHGHL